MGIAAKKSNVDITGLRVDVTKEMITSPERRIGTITVDLHMPKGIPVDQRPLLERAAHTCPVHKSLHPDVKTPITFHYSD